MMQIGVSNIYKNMLIRFLREFCGNSFYMYINKPGTLQDYYFEGRLLSSSYDRLCIAIQYQASLIVPIIVPIPGPILGSLLFPRHTRHVVVCLFEHRWFSVIFYEFINHWNLVDGKLLLLVS